MNKRTRKEMKHDQDQHYGGLIAHCDSDTAKESFSRPVYGSRQEFEDAEQEKENFVVTIPAQNDTGRIRVYDHGELVFDYSGKINIINDGRNGNAIEIEARTKEKGYE